MKNSSYKYSELFNFVSVLMKIIFCSQSCECFYKNKKIAHKLVIIFIESIILSQTCDSFNKIRKIITEYKIILIDNHKIVMTS